MLYSSLLFLLSGPVAGLLYVAVARSAEERPCTVQQAKLYSVDTMLGRLEGAFLARRRLIDDASHEPRSPLAIMSACSRGRARGACPCSGRRPGRGPPRGRPRTTTPSPTRARPAGETAVNDREYRCDWFIPIGVNQFR
ncbi:hypothetical protein [Streptosporangium sp. NPDC023615]|uniref:hypothetical protein n=1 Tax=Streptosporangium sp. NPDC023615 TaxID=3154794 RepID=UPI0034160BDC